MNAHDTHILYAYERTSSGALHAGRYAALPTPDVHCKDCTVYLMPIVRWSSHVKSMARKTHLGDASALAGGDNRR